MKLGGVPDEAIVVYILGATASGKTEMAIDLAWPSGASIVCLDRHTTTAGADIGTAKPTSDERQRVNHYLLNKTTFDGTVVSRAMFRRMAVQAVRELLDRDQGIPFVVGATTRAIDELVYGARRDLIRADFVENLEGKDLTALVGFAKDNDYRLPFMHTDPQGQKNASDQVRESVDRRRLMDAIIYQEFTHRVRHRPSRGTLLLGIERPQVELDVRIEARVQKMLERGLEAEVAALMERSNTISRTYLEETIGYKEFAEYFQGKISLSQVRQLIVDHTKRYARWQQDELRYRFPHMQWVSGLHEARQALKRHLVYHRQPVGYLEQPRGMVFALGTLSSVHESWYALTQALGASVSIHQQLYDDYRSGRLSYEVAKTKLLRLWAATGNANKKRIRRIFESWPLDSSSQEVVGTAKQRGNIPCLITGFVDLYAEVVAKKLNVKHWYANTTLYWDKDDKLVDMDYDLRRSERKIQQFNAFCCKYGFTPQECIVLGDGGTDLGMFALSRRGILVGENHPQEYNSQTWKVTPKLSGVQDILTHV